MGAPIEINDDAARILRFELEPVTLQIGVATVSFRRPPSANHCFDCEIFALESKGCGQRRFAMQGRGSRIACRLDRLAHESPSHEVWLQASDFATFPDRQAFARLRPTSQVKIPVVVQYRG